MNLSDTSWSNGNFSIKTVSVNGVVSDYDTHYVPIMTGGTSVSANSTSNYHGGHTVDVTATNNVHTTVRNMTSFWFRTEDAGDIRVTHNAPLPCANGHRLRLTHIIVGADPNLSDDIHDCFVFFNLDTGTAFGVIGTRNEQTREIKAEEVYTEVNAHWKAFSKGYYRVVESAEKTYVRTRINKSMSTGQRVVDLSFGLAVLLAIGGWFLSPVLGVVGVLGVPITLFISRRMGAKMEVMQSWIASKVAMVPVIMQVFETAFSTPVEEARLSA